MTTRMEYINSLAEGDTVIVSTPALNATTPYLTVNKQYEAKIFLHASCASIFDDVGENIIIALGTHEFNCLHTGTAWKIHHPSGEIL